MKAESLPENSTALQRLIAAHDGDVALLYLLRQQRPGCDMEEAAGALCRTLGEMRAAEEKLRRMGLWDEDGERAAPTREAVKHLPPADELPQYSAQDIRALSESSAGFEAVCREAAQIKGRQLSSAELGVLAGIVDYLRLPYEVVLLLLHYCREQAEARHPGSRPSFRAIQSAAFRWANLELLSPEQAEDFIRGEQDRGEAVARIQALLGLTGRALTAPERRHIESWLSQGFDDGAIELAYERTVYNTGGLKWPYMDKILSRWHEAGLHDRAAVEAGDPPRLSQRRGEATQSYEPVDLDSLKAVLDSI